MTTRRHSPPAGGLLTIAEAAEHLGVSRRTLERRIAAGALAVFRDGGIVRVSAIELRQYVAAQTVRSVSGGAPRPAGGSPPHRLWD